MGVGERCYANKQDCECIYAILLDYTEYKIQEINRDKGLASERQEQKCTRSSLLFVFAFVCFCLVLSSLCLVVGLAVVSNRT